MKKSCLIIAGEKSAEEHALSFFKELKSKTPDTDYYGVAGEELQSCGFELLYHLKTFSTMGITEVIKKLFFYIKAMNKILKEVDVRQTKSAILIDYQSFNMRLAKKLKKRGVNVLYYVAPHAWAWKEWRVVPLRESIHTLFTIFPFEKNWFGSRGVERIIGVKHPLWVNHESKVLDSMSTILARPNIATSSAKEIVLLPGSRNFEVETLLPVFIAAIKELKQKYAITVSLVQSRSVNESLYTPYLNEIDKCYWNTELSTALASAQCALAASGTVTLGTAFYGVPTVVCYKGSLFNYLIFKLVVPYKGPFAPANIVHQKRVMPELMQWEMSKENIITEMKKYLDDANYYQTTKDALLRTSDLLTGDLISVPDYMAQVIGEQK